MNPSSLLRCVVPLLIIVALAPALGAADEVLTPTPLQPWERADGLPADRQGRFPIEQPKCEGVKQLLLLSSRWVVVVTVNQDEVYRQIDALSSGAFFRTIAAWDACDKARPDWTAYKARSTIRDQYVAAARERAGERRLDEPAFYTITGDDPAFARPRQPTRVARTIVGLGGETAPEAHQALRGLGGVYYAHYSYLEMPAPLQPGKTYTIAIGSGQKVTFLYDETRLVSRAIKVNQAGYLPDATGKYAYLGAWLLEYGGHDFSFAPTFKVVAVDSGKVVYTGALKLRDAASRCPPKPNAGAASKEPRPLLTGEDVYEMDLGGLKATGTFFITIPGVGRSWTFRHAPDVYGDVFYTACRGLFHQRCGIALGEPFTAWPRQRCHTDPIYEAGTIPWCAGADFKVPKNYEIFDVVGGTITSRTNGAPVAKNLLPLVPHTANPTGGGWHDAADWDREITHYSCIFDLLNAYELAPAKFSDGQLNIPESGNGIPDILDEAEFGLRIWKLSMTPEGGVAGVAETWTHPTIDDPAVQYSFSRRTRWSSLVFAAAAAQYAHLVKPFSAAAAADYAAAADKAYAFGNNPVHSLDKITIDARHQRGAGAPYTLQWEETDTMIRPFLAQARLRLAILKHDPSLLQEIPELTRGVLMPYQWPNTFKDFSPWLYFDAPHRFADALPAATVATWRDFYTQQADTLTALNPGMPYRCSWPAYQDYWMGWGASTMYNFDRAIWIANALRPNAKYREAAIQNMDFMLGCNPLGMSWTTGIGWSYPVDIQHGPSENDGILDPVPGITIYGLTGGAYPELRNAVWRAPKADAPGGFVDFVKPANIARPVWRQWSCNPHLNAGQCEFTVHETMAASIFASAMLLPDGWKPGADLKARQPRRDDLLFGYYYLP